METYYCNAKNCDRKNSCNHYLVIKQLPDENDWMVDVERNYIEEDLTDICLPEFRLFIFGNKYKNFPGKKYYQSLLKFFDKICEGDQCKYCQVYDSQFPAFPASRVECKRGKEYTCNHEKHPINNSISELLQFLEAEDKAFEVEGLETGTVQFICPICGGKAIGNRYYSPYSGRLKGLGSHCEKCQLSHT